MADKIQLRGDTQANWLVSDPTPADRELVIETDTRRHKIGDGLLKYSELEYAGGSDEKPASAIFMFDLTITDTAKRIEIATAFIAALQADPYLQVAVKTIINAETEYAMPLHLPALLAYSVDPEEGGQYMAVADVSSLEAGVYSATIATAPEGMEMPEGESAIHIMNWGVNLDMGTTMPFYDQTECPYNPTDVQKLTYLLAVTANIVAYVGEEYIDRRHSIDETCFPLDLRGKNGSVEKWSVTKDDRGGVRNYYIEIYHTSLGMQGNGDDMYEHKRLLYAKTVVPNNETVVVLQYWYDMDFVEPINCAGDPYYPIREWWPYGTDVMQVYEYQIVFEGEGLIFDADGKLNLANNWGEIKQASIIYLDMFDSAGTNCAYGSYLKIKDGDVFLVNKAPAATITKVSIGMKFTRIR